MGFTDFAPMAPIAHLPVLPRLCLVMGMLDVAESNGVNLYVQFGPADLRDAARSLLNFNTSY